MGGDTTVSTSKLRGLVTAMMAQSIFDVLGWNLLFAVGFFKKDEHIYRNEDLPAVTQVKSLALECHTEKLWQQINYNWLRNNFLDNGTQPGLSRAKKA